MREMKHAPVKIDEAGAPVGTEDHAGDPGSTTPQRPAPGRTRFRILGSLEVDRGGEQLPLGGPQQRAVLAHLIVRANDLVPTEVLVDGIWGDDAPEAARNTIYTYVSHLRKALGADRIEGRTPGYRLQLDPPELDAARFDKLVNDARKAGVIDAGIAATVFDEALALWHGPALADVAGDGALRAEAARLDELRLVASEERIDALLAIGEHVRVIGEAEALVTEHPLRERLWGQLILALYRGGRQADALTAYQRAREMLADELGIEPSPELVRLHERILKQDPALELRGEPLRGYRLLEKIGEGPTGVVFRAIQPHVGRDVAVKIFHEHIASDPAFVRRFEQEAQAAATLEHPHIVPIYDYWREPGRAYVVSRYLKSGSLEALRGRGEQVDHDRAVLIVEQIASALAFAHRQQIAHGNLRPSNVVFDGERNAYLVDLRIGVGPEPHLADDVRALASLTRDLFPGDLPRRLGQLVEETDLERHPPAADAFADAARTASEPAPIASSPAVDVRNPYKGLRPFTEADAHDFFGRAELTARLLSRFGEPGQRSRFLAVVGPSGGGKSSVVRAGMVPAIRRGALGDPDRIFVAEMLPGTHPIEELEAALLRVAARPVSQLHEVIDRGTRGLLEAVELVLPSHAELVLVVDQFEEVFTLTVEERERELFLESLRVATADPDSRVRVIATLRADFYDRPLIYPRFGELLATRTEAVPPLTPDELEQAIREPAEGVGVSLEPGLIAEIVADVAHQPGALPLLQYALTELFERRDGPLALTSYQEIRGVAGALSARADRLFDAADNEGKRATKQVFLRLVSLREGRQDTRRRVLRSDLHALGVDPEVIDAVIDTFGHHRLLTFDREPSTREPTVEIAHEALLGAWERLRHWIDGAREDLRQDRLLARAAGEWRAADHDPSFLLRGARLQQVEAWSLSTDLAIGLPERRYLKASLDHQDWERAGEDARREREERTERRSRARLKALVAVFAVAALVASVLTAIAVDQRQEAARRLRESFSRELAAASVAELDVDPDRSILLAMEAVDQTRSADGSVLREAEEALHRAVVASRIGLSVPGIGRSLDWSSDGLVATTRAIQDGGQGERVVTDIRDARTGDVLRTIDGHGGEPSAFVHREIAFSADGSMLATTGIDGKLDVWDPSTGELLTSVARGGQSYGPSFSADGSLVAAIWDKDAQRPRIHVLDMSTNRMRTYTADANDAALSPDGTRIAAATRVWLSVIDLETGKVVRHRGPGQQTYVRTSWSPNGRYVAMGGWHGEVPIWDTETWELHPRLPDVSAFSLDWSPDSSRLVTVGDDDIARVWQITDDDARQIHSLSAEGQGNWGVAFSPDGLSVATVGDPRALTTWDLGPNGDAEWANLAGVWDMRFAPTGHRLIAVRGPDVALTTLDVDSGRLEPGNGSSEPIPSWKIIGRDLSPDGGAIVVEHHTTGLFEPGRVTVRDAASGRVMFKVPGLVEWGGVRWAPDGRHLAVGMVGGNTSIVDRSGSVLRTIGPDLGGGPGEFSPDGRLIAMDWGHGENVRIVDWELKEVVRTIPGPTDGFAFDLAGAQLATNGPRHKIWDVRSGRLISTLPAIPGEGTYALEFSPDGSRLAVGGSDEIVRLFDVATGRETLVLEGHDDLIGALAFSPDGSMLAAQSGSEVRIWALDIDDLLEIAQGEVTRSLTDEECRQYLRVDRCPS